MDNVGITAVVDDPAPVRELSKAEVRARGATDGHLMQAEIGAIRKVESRGHICNRCCLDA